MLKSKYLTEQGVREMLQHIHDKGFRYIYFDTDCSSFVASQKEPCFENGYFMYCNGFKKDIADGFSTKVLDDLLSHTLYIDITEQLGLIDWSTIKVDTPILVSDRTNGSYARRHFAKYENGTIYAWENGYTSWSTPSEESIVEWKHAKLA